MTHFPCCLCLGTHHLSFAPDSSLSSSVTPCLCGSICLVSSSRTAQPLRPPAVCSDMHLTLKQRWKAMLKGQPGQRFQDRYREAKKSRADAAWGQKARRALRLLVAMVAIVIAVFLMVLPGPAVLFYFFAGTLLASESLTVARLLDWTEVRLRAVWKWGKGHWGRTPAWGRAALVALVVCLSATSTYISYRLVAN